jgi:hypothetical protein
MQNQAKPQVRLGEWISEGWRMFTEQWKAWVVNALIFLGITVFPVAAVSIGSYLYFLSILTTTPRNATPDISGEAVFGFLMVLLVTILFSLVTQSFLLGGMHLSAMKQLRGEKVEVRDLFSGGSYFFQILGATLLIVALCAIGYLLCILPAFLVLGALFFTIPLIVDRRLGVVEAMKTSYELTRRNIWMFTLFVFVLYFLASAGNYACFVGMLATYPLLFTVTAVAYRDLFGLEGARYFRPPIPGYPQPYADVYQPHQPLTPPVNYWEQADEKNLRPVLEPPPRWDDPPSSSKRPPAAGAEPSADNPGNKSLPTNPEPPATDQIVPPVTESIPSAPTGLVCSQCQTALPPTAGFCPRCGTRVG